MSEFSHDRIQVACELRGWSLVELSNRANINYQTLIDLKKGRKEFNEELAQFLSRALNLPINFFIIKGSTPEESTLTFRAPRTLTKRRKLQIMSEYGLLSSAVKSLIEMSRMDGQSQWIPDVASKARPTADSIEHVAMLTRMILNLRSSGPVPNVIRAFERGGMVVAPLQSSNLADKQGRRADGISQPSSVVPVIGYYSHPDTGDRLRFTIAHEVGHLILHKYADTSLTWKIREDEANQFASAFLMPENDARNILKPYMNLTDLLSIKARWGISIAALITRATRLSIIDKDRQRSLMVQLSARHWRQHEPIHVEVESPILLRQMVGSAFGEILSPTHIKASRRGVEGFLGLPFSLVSGWCDGLSEMDKSNLID